MFVIMIYTFSKLERAKLILHVGTDLSVLLN